MNKSAAAPSKRAGEVRISVKANSVILTEKGLQQSKRLFHQLFVERSACSG